MDDIYRNAHKTDKKMREIIKLQGKRLKKLNEDYKGLLKEQKITYKEMIYFRFKARRKTQIIDKAIEYINCKQFVDGIRIQDIPEKEELLNILKGDSDE